MGRAAMTGRPRLFGAEYSVYVRIVRLALAEKGTDYELVPVDIFASDGPPQDYLERHPFGRIPAFEYEGFRLYETGAITRYVDDVFDGRRLQPLDPRERARCNQLKSIADNYAYPTLVWGVYVERVSKPASGAAADENAIAAALPKARTLPQGDFRNYGNGAMARRRDHVARRPLCRPDIRLFPQGAGRAGNAPGARDAGGVVGADVGETLDDGDAARIA
jgi:hypothetical protein